MRIVKQIEIEGRGLRALFDSGATYSYIRDEFRPSSTRTAIPITVGLGGVSRRLEEICNVDAKIEGLDFDITAYVVRDLGQTEYGPLDAIIGALTLEAWWIKLDPKTGELDLTQLQKREFTEYWG